LSVIASPPTAEPARGDRTPGEVRSVQYLRGLAAFGVLAFHAADRAGWAFGAGAAGVDVFFVISGFIMWVVTCRRPGSPLDFLKRRVERIAPLYWGLTLGVAATAVLAPGVLPAMKPTLSHVVQSLAFAPHRDAQGLIAPLIVPGWTLNYEMFFYLLFAAGLLAPARLRAWLVSAALAALVAIHPLGDPANPLWATYTNPLLLEFGAGVWLGKAWSENRLPGPRAAYGLMALGAAGFVGLALAGLDVEPARVIYWGVPALLLVTGAISLERRGPIPNWKPLRLLGDASYSLYLVHGLAISAAFRLLKGAGLGAPALFAASLAVGVAAGLLVYQFAEKPLARLFKTGMAARRTAPPAISAPPIAEAPPTPGREAPAG
jgi:exopolysaccharide production protein ExoZ